MLDVLLGSEYTSAIVINLFKNGLISSIYAKQFLNILERILDYPRILSISQFVNMLVNLPRYIQGRM